MLNHIKRYSSRAKNIGIKIKDNQVILVIPKAKFFQSQNKLTQQAENFLKAKEKWVLSKLNQKKKQNPIFTDYSKETFLKYKQQAEKLVQEKVKYWAEKMWLTYNKITIKNLKSKWWSCSIKNNLNFNYKIIFLSEKDQNYLVVHELSHLVYMNHQKEFWDLVCKTLWNKEFRRYKINTDIW